LQTQSLTQSCLPLSIPLLATCLPSELAVVSPMELGNVFVNLAALMQRMLGLP